MHQAQWSPERPLPPPVSLTSQSHHEKPLRSPAQVEGTQGFLPQPGKALERPSATICQQIWKTQQWPEDWKRSVFTSIPRKGNAKECSNYSTIALISHTSKVMLKILQDGLQQYTNCELPDVQAGLRKGRGTRDQIANIRWIMEKAREFQKNIYFCFIDYA